MMTPSSERLTRFWRHFWPHFWPDAAVMNLATMAMAQFNAALKAPCSERGDIYERAG